MLDIFSSQPGKVGFYLNKSSTPAVLKIEYPDWKVVSWNCIVTGAATGRASNVQFSLSLDKFIYVYIFGQKPGLFSITGITYGATCPNAGKKVDGYTLTGGTLGGGAPGLGGGGSAGGSSGSGYEIHSTAPNVPSWLNGETSSNNSQVPGISGKLFASPAGKSNESDDVWGSNNTGTSTSASLIFKSTTQATAAPPQGGDQEDEELLDNLPVAAVAPPPANPAVKKLDVGPQLLNLVLDSTMHGGAHIEEIYNKANIVEYGFPVTIVFADTTIKAFLIEMSHTIMDAEFRMGRFNMNFVRVQ